MKKHTRLLSILLAISMLLPLTACSENNSDESAGNEAPASETAGIAETDAAIAEEAEERIKPDIPETGDFGGDDIRFMFWKISFWSSGVHESRDIYSEGLNGEAINDSVYNRNMKIEDAYNVKISLDILEFDTIVNTITNCVRSGDDTYDVVYPRMVEATPLFSDNSLLNIREIPNIDISKPWWDSNCADTMTIYGYLPFIATSININDKDATAAMVFNKTLNSNYQLEDPYTLVREGKWTVDKVSELADMVDTDLDGDGIIGESDLIGFLGMRDVMESFFYGSGSRHATKTDDGGIAFTYGTERDINVTQTIMDLMAQNFFVNSHLDFPEGREGRDVFMEGNTLLFWIRLGEVTNMRAGDQEFGIVPIPKYEESQENYYSMVSRHSTGLLSVPTTAHGEKLEQLGIILEAMAAESHYTLIPEYIDVSLKTKHSRDEESAEMLDIIIASRMFDPMYYYNLGSFADSFVLMGEPGYDNISSFLKSRQKMMSKTVEKFLETIQENISLTAAE